MLTSFNGYLGGPIGSIIGAILIFVIGWLVALGIAALVRNVLAKVNINQRMNTSTGKSYDLEGIISKVVFWFIFIIAISMALDQLNLNSISAPFANGTFIPVGYIIGRVEIQTVYNGFISVTIALVVLNLIGAYLWKRGIESYAGTGA